MKKNQKYFGYVALALVLAIMVGSTAFLISTSPSADAESVTLNQNATVVTSPFTEAVDKVHGSVLGVNNYTNYRPNTYSYNFGFGTFSFDDGSKHDDEQREVLQGTGSGVVVAKDYVLTNYHVVENASRLEVTGGEKTYPAELKATDKARDLAVMYVKDLDIDPVVLGDSDVLHVGDWAICIGNPLSFKGTTTVGIISSLNREIKGQATDAYGKRAVNSMIQTDAAINAGNSGGGMFNTAGELIGIPSLKFTGSAFSNGTVEGIGMAIPINEAKPLIEAAISGKGNVSDADEDGDAANTIASGDRPRIGVTVTPLNPNSYALSNGSIPNGAYVTDVEKGSPAEKAGIEVADIIVEVDGNVIKDTKQMVSLLRAKEVGDTAAIKVYRVEGGLDKVEDQTNIPEGEYIDLTVELKMLDEVQQ